MKINLWENFIGGFIIAKKNITKRNNIYINNSNKKIKPIGCLLQKKMGQQFRGINGLGWVERH